MGGLEHLNLLRMFDIIYSERSLTHAGLALNISESAVDNALHRLKGKPRPPPCSFTSGVAA
ncbi:hypothetical protein HHL26_16385 [Sphingobium sp. TB-6]|uniref:hypothetical protein n=1 Tax=Sphingobium sp. TB-6 TaxID=2728850 RepID=UPI00146CCE6C|nr:MULTISPECIES: hypothetical protein [Sphingomonadaceae]NML90628.1 hypothetical protein [Sphingobium sp. TB-6]